MNPIKTFPVFGDPVDVIVASQSTNRSFSAIVQHTSPGGGPPPHLHAKDDEVFLALEGDFELFDGSVWHPLPCGELRYSLRGQLHTFRNSGTTPGRILIIATPGGLDEYLEAISPVRMPEGAADLFSISDGFGITFPPPESPVSAMAQTSAGI